jgi:hypothetical protein
MGWKDWLYKYSRHLVFSGSYISTFLLFFITRMKNRELPYGFHVLAYQTDDICYHIHHWIYSGAFSSLILIVIWLSEGIFNYSVLLYLGFLLGLTSSDIIFTDFNKIRENCFILLGENLHNDTLNKIL